MADATTPTAREVIDERRERKRREQEWPERYSIPLAKVLELLPSAQLCAGHRAQLAILERLEGWLALEDRHRREREELRKRQQSEREDFFLNQQLRGSTSTIAERLEAAGDANPFLRTTTAAREVLELLGQDHRDEQPDAAPPNRQSRLERLREIRTGYTGPSELAPGADKRMDVVFAAAAHEVARLLHEVSRDPGGKFYWEDVRFVLIEKGHPEAQALDAEQIRARANRFVRREYA